MSYSILFNKKSNIVTKLNNDSTSERHFLRHILISVTFI